MQFCFDKAYVFDRGSQEIIKKSWKWLVKTEVLHLSRNSVQYFSQVGGELLKQVEKFKYLGGAFVD